MKVLGRNDAIGKICVQAGDTLVGTYTGPDGVKRVVGRHEIKDAMIVDTFVVVAPEEGELGLKDGIGCIFGVKA